MRTPDFICIGAQKAGTTTLHDILRQHPDLYLPEDNKEMRFFDLEGEYAKGLDYWLNLYFKSYNNQKRIGVFTPDYLFYKKVPGRIAKDFGKELKFLVILRNPVNRAYSHYLMSKRRGHEKLSFKEAIDQEKERISTGIETDLNRYSYISRGLYSEQIERYFQFFPKDHFLFLSFEKEIKTNLPQTVQKILSFLDLDPMELNTEIVSNKASGVHSSKLQEIVRNDNLFKRMLKSILPRKYRERLRKKVIAINESKTIDKTTLDNELKHGIFKKFFADEPRKLSKLTGIDFSYWEKDFKTE